MALLEITVQPTENVTHFVTSVVLEERRYTFDFYTNTSDGAWYFDLANDDETAVIKGIGLANGIDLLYLYRHLDLPPGALFIFDKGLEGADPDLRAFVDDRAALYYLTSDLAFPPAT